MQDLRSQAISSGWGHKNVAIEGLSAELNTVETSMHSNWKYPVNFVSSDRLSSI